MYRTPFLEHKSCIKYFTPSLILSSWVSYGLKNRKINEDKLANQLLPFFVLRSTTFWMESETKSPMEIEKLLKKQISLLYKNILKEKNNVLLGKT